MLKKGQSPRKSNQNKNQDQMYLILSWKIKDENFLDELVKFDG